MTGLALTHQAFAHLREHLQIIFTSENANVQTFSIKYIANMQVEHNVYIFLLQNKNKIGKHTRIIMALPKLTW